MKLPKKKEKNLVVRAKHGNIFFSLNLIKIKKCAIVNRLSFLTNHDFDNYSILSTLSPPKLLLKSLLKSLQNRIEYETGKYLKVWKH